MLVLHPSRVTFGSQVWEGVRGVSVDRSAARLVEEWGDGGPYAVLADVPEQRVMVTVVQEMSRGDLTGLRPGDQGLLTVGVAPEGNELGRRRLSCTGVVREVSHDLTRRPALRRVTLVAVSSDGAADPVSVEEAPGGG